MQAFVAKTEGHNRVGLCDLLQRYDDEHCVAAHMTPEQAAESVLDCFERAVGVKPEARAGNRSNGNALDKDGHRGTASDMGNY